MGGKLRAQVLGGRGEMLLAKTHKFVWRISSKFLAQFAVRSFIFSFLRIVRRQTGRPASFRHGAFFLSQPLRVLEEP